MLRIPGCHIHLSFKTLTSAISWKGWKVWMGIFERLQRNFRRKKRVKNKRIHKWKNMHVRFSLIRTLDFRWHRNLSKWECVGLYGWIQGLKEHHVSFFLGPCVLHSSVLASFLVDSLLLATYTVPRIHPHSLTDTIKITFILLLSTPPPNPCKNKPLTFDILSSVWPCLGHMPISAVRGYILIPSEPPGQRMIQGGPQEIWVFLPYENTDHSAIIPKCPLHMRKNIFV